MNAFSYVEASTVDEALREHGSSRDARYLAGGTNLIDHLRLGIDQPERLIDVRKLGLDRIEETGESLRIGAGVTNTALAKDPRVQERYPALAKAILGGASPQIRNIATVGGNLLQGTRCTYFRDGISACNKRLPGSGCSAIDGVNRMHAVLGTSEKCIAAHPSDMAVALVALDAVVHTQGTSGRRALPIGDFYVPYGDDPAKETVLEPGELIVSIELPDVSWYSRSTYVKARDRASFEFALASAAVAVDVHDGIVRGCRIALGGVASKPWRALRAEATLRGKQPGEAQFQAAAEAEFQKAAPQKDNGFKIELCKRVIARALLEVC